MPPSSRKRARVLLTAVALLALAALAAAVSLLLVQRNAGRGPGSVSIVGSAPPSPVAPSGTPSALVSPPPSASATAAASPLSGPDNAGPRLVPLNDPNGPQDVAAQLFPQGPDGVACGSAHNTYGTGCALTHRFATRLSQLYQERPPYEPLCRCQAAWSSVTIGAGDPGPHATDPNAAAASVSFTINGRHESLTVLVERTVDGWLAADTWCGNSADQSMYSAQPLACPAT